MIAAVTYKTRHSMPSSLLSHLQHDADLRANDFMTPETHLQHARDSIKLIY